MDGELQTTSLARPEVALTLRSFAMRVVSELARTTGVGQGSFSPDLADKLIGYARSGDQGTLSELYAELQQRRVTADEVIDRYLPHAVNVIGQQWHDEEIDILHASMACARMQNMLREMGRVWASDRAGRTYGARILLTLPVGEQHTLGVMLAAHHLRRRGVSVKVMLLPDVSKLRAMIEHHRFHAVFLSVSNLSSLQSCALMVGELRAVTHGRVPVVIGGGLVSNEIADIDPRRIKEITGADVVTNNIEHALHSCGIQQISVAAE